MILDASALLELLLQRPQAEAVADHIFHEGVTLHAPELIDLEILHVLRRYQQKGLLTDRRAEEALQDFSDLGIERYSHQPLRERIWALRSNLTAYDAAYVVLAEALKQPLLTCDAKLASSVGHRAKIILP